MLRRGESATTTCVEDVAPGDPVARRLRELGFVAGEQVRIVARGLRPSDPLVVHVGSTRFALRRAEAARIIVEPDHARR